MSDEPKPNTPADGATPPADKPQFKVTRSPFAPKVAGSDQDDPIKQPDDESAKQSTPAAPTPPTPAAPTPPKPVAAPKPKAPKPAKPQPKAGTPAIALETESAGVSMGTVAIDAVCAVVAIAFAVLIFMNLQG